MHRLVQRRPKFARARQQTRMSHTSLYELLRKPLDKSLPQQDCKSFEPHRVPVSAKKIFSRRASLAGAMGVAIISFEAPLDLSIASVDSTHRYRGLCHHLSQSDHSGYTAPSADRNP